MWVCPLLADLPLAPVASGILRSLVPGCARSPSSSSSTLDSLEASVPAAAAATWPQLVTLWSPRIVEVVAAAGGSPRAVLGNKLPNRTF